METAPLKLTWRPGLLSHLGSGQLHGRMSFLGLVEPHAMPAFREPRSAEGLEALGQPGLHSWNQSQRT